MPEAATCDPAQDVPRGTERKAHMSKYVASHKLTDEERAALRDPLDVADVANVLGKSRRWVQERSRVGEIPCTRVGNTYRFSKAAILRYAGITGLEA